MGRYTQHTMEVPESIALPSDPDDQSREGEVTVVFEWCPGSEPRGMSGPPENYDPGEDDDFVILSSGTIAGADLHDNIVEGLIEWIDEHWERPVEDIPEFEPEEW